MGIYLIPYKDKKYKIFKIIIIIIKISKYSGTQKSDRCHEKYHWKFKKKIKSIFAQMKNKIKTKTLGRSVPDLNLIKISKQKSWQKIFDFTGHFIVSNLFLVGNPVKIF